MATSTAPILFGSLTVVTATASLATLVLPRQSPWAKVIALSTLAIAVAALVWNLSDPTGFP